MRLTSISLSFDDRLPIPICPVRPASLWTTSRTAIAFNPLRFSFSLPTSCSVSSINWLTMDWKSASSPSVMDRSVERSISGVSALLPLLVWTMLNKLKSSCSRNGLESMASKPSFNNSVLSCGSTCAVNATNFMVWLYFLWSSWHNSIPLISGMRISIRMCVTSASGFSSRNNFASWNVTYGIWFFSRIRPQSRRIIISSSTTITLPLNVLSSGLTADSSTWGTLTALSNGSVTLKVDPWPGTLATSNEPPCASTSDFAIVSPKPVPP